MEQTIEGISAWLRRGHVLFFFAFVCPLPFFTPSYLSPSMISFLLVSLYPSLFIPLCVHPLSLTRSIPRLYSTPLPHFYSLSLSSAYFVPPPSPHLPLSPFILRPPLVTHFEGPTPLHPIFIYATGWYHRLKQDTFHIREKIARSRMKSVFNVPACCNTIRIHVRDTSRIMK